MLEEHGGSVEEALSYLDSGYDLFWNPEPNGRVYALEPFDPRQQPAERFSLLALGTTDRVAS